LFSAAHTSQCDESFLWLRHSPILLKDSPA
jgi:hypothetical protein